MFLIYAEILKIFCIFAAVININIIDMSNVDFKIKTKKINKDSIKPTPFPIKLRSIKIDNIVINNKAYGSKFFTNGVSVMLGQEVVNEIMNKKRRITMSDLSVFCFLVSECDYSANYVKATIQDIAFGLNCSLPTVVKAIKNLTQLRFLMNFEQSGYIINHNYGIKGSYDTFVKNYIRLYPQDVDNVVTLEEVDFTEEED